MFKSNYRPISVLSTIPKVFERLKFDQLHRHFSPSFRLPQIICLVFFLAIHVVLPYLNRGEPVSIFTNTSVHPLPRPLPEKLFLTSK